MAEEDPLFLKLFIGKTKKRIKAPPTLAPLRDLIAKSVTSIHDVDQRIFYYDSEEDEIDISEEEDYENALSYSKRREIKLLQLYVRKTVEGEELEEEKLTPSAQLDKQFTPATSVLEQSMITVTEELPVPLPPATAPTATAQEFDAAVLAKLPVDQQQFLVNRLLECEPIKARIVAALKAELADDPVEVRR